MSVVALFTWIATIAAGLVLFVIWIIEYDPEFQSAAATRLPVPVISLHAFLGLSRADAVVSATCCSTRGGWPGPRCACWARSPSSAWSWRPAGSACTAPSPLPVRR